VRDMPPGTGKAASTTAGGIPTGNLQSQKNEDSKPLVSDVTVKLDGISFEFTLPFEGKTILEAALEQGADLPYSCKGGVCSTCRAKLVEGQVAMDLNYALEPEEVDDGFILCCQSHPRTAKVVVDFDKR
jgi:ring-1,2-phenylacetyl-CoA epoxidase subunit PaaE